MVKSSDNKDKVQEGQVVSDSQTQSDGASASKLRNATNNDPGYNLGIVSLILSLVGITIPAFIVGYFGYKESKEAGCKNIMAIIGMVISGATVVLIALAIMIMAIFLIFIAASQS